MFKPKGRHVRQSQVEKFTRYSIRKVSFGAASVAVASGLFFLGGGSVQASEQVTNSETREVQNAQNVNDKSSESKEVAGQDTALTKETSILKEDSTDKTPNVATEKVAINTAALEDLVAKAESRLSQLTEGKKTKSVIDDAKNLVNKAKELLNDDTKTQVKVDALAKQLSSSLSILNSIKSEVTEEKVNKNQDPRNGQAIPGNGESGFRTDASGNDGTTTATTTVTNDELTPTTPAKPTAKNIVGSTSTVSRENFTGWDTYKMPFGVQSGSGTLGVDTAEQKANAEGLQFRVFSDQRAGTRVTPGPSNFTFALQPSDVKARVDYGLKLPAEEVQKIIEEAPLWRGKLKYNGTRIQSSAASTYFGGGPYEYLLSSVYKLGYEQGIDKVYVKDASKRIEVTEEAKAAGWTVSDFTVSNMPGGLVYDKQSDSIQGVVTHSSPFNYQKLVATVTFTNTKTGKNVRIPLDLHRYGGTAWKDGTPPTLEINDTVKEGKVGEDLVVPVEYRDAGASHAGAPNGRNISYNLTDENGNPLNRTATIRETVGRAILGVSGVKITGTTGDGASTVTDLTGDDTKIPGVGFTIASNDMTERNKNGFKGTPTEAGIYRVSIYARDYKETNANEAYAHATFKISPAVSVKNVHAYDKEVPITISKGASEATITLPDGTNTKVVAKDGKWVVTETTNTAVNVNDEIGTVGETFNLKVLPTATAEAATDNIKVTASSENVTATFTRAEVTLKTQVGENVTATFNKTTGRWDLPAEIAEKKTVNSDGTTTWLKRDLYVDVDKNGETIFNVYEYIRTLNAEGKVTAVSDPTRTLTTYNKENAANSAAESANDTNKGMIVTVKYDKGLNKWTADDNSTVTATKTGDKWTISTSSGFNGTVDAVYAESSDKASVLNDAPTVHSTSYTTVKGATVDLVKQKSATVTITDREDDATTAPNKKETTVTKVTLTAPSGKVTEYTSVSDAAAVKLTETGEYTVKVDVKDSNGNKVTADSDTATGTNENDNTAVASTTYVITVKDQETNKLYKVEDDTVTNDELKGKVNPTTVDGFTPSKNDITDIPTTTGKAGQTLPTPATVTYTKDTETIQVETKVDVVVLPKVTPTGVTVLKDSTNLENVVKEKAKEAAKAIATDKIPTGVTVSIKEVKAGTLPGTTTIGDQTPAKVVVEYKDANNNVVETREVEVPVTVIGSTVNKIVKFEDDELTDEEVKAAVTPGTNGTKGEPLLTANITAEPGTKEVAIPVTYNNGELSERVVVPVVVLPTATGEVEVPKGSTVDKVKEVTKAKATEVATSAEFKAKLPEGSKDVVVGEITEEVLATMTAEKGTNKGIVKVPVTYTVDGKTYTKDAEITVNVLGSEAKTVYTLEGTKPDAEKVKNAVTPDTGGTANAPTESALPETTGKAGAKDVTATTTVTYPTGDETVKVPVEVLPKATPEKVTTLKDTTSDNLTTAVKEKAQAALGKLTLPTGVTVELVPNQNYAVPATDSNGDKTAVPVKVQYKDSTGTVVAEDTISVPVTVVSSTPSKIVVFEGETPTAEQAKEAVTTGTDGTKGEPTTLPETTGKAGATDVKVDVPVTYDNGKLTETVSVPVTVLPKATGEADVPKGSTVDKVKEVAKAKATALVAATDFTGKLPTGATVTVGNITEAVAETITTEKGTNKGIVNVPATYTVDGQTYNTTVPVTINVLGSEPKTVYTVEGTKPDAEKVKNAVTPDTGGTVGTPTETDLPETTGKVGAKDVTATTTVTYSNGTETVNVPVEVLPKATPEKVITLKDTTGDNLTTAVKEKAQAALGKLALPSGVTAELDPNQTYTVPATTSNGDKGNVAVKVQYKDATGTVVAEDTISVPVTVVSSTPSKIVVFEGETPTAEQAKEAVTTGTDGTKGEPTTLPETTGKAGATDVKVDVPVTYDNGKLTETVSVPVTVLPKPEADEILVPKNGDKEKAKEKVLAQAKKSIEDATFKGKLPQGATVTVDETATITVPDLTEDTEVDVTVKYTVDGQDKTTTVKVPVTVVEGVPQIVPVKETNDVLPDPEKSIDKEDYPEGSRFRYKTPDGQTSPIDVTTTGDKNVVVEVLDPQGNTIVEVPSTVRVVGSTPQFVVADPAKKQPEAKDSVTPGEYPDGTTFEYKTPVDTTTAGEKDVTVVAKLNGQPIAEVPAKVVVVDPKTQYVVADPSKPQPDASKSIDPEQYPDGTTFEYKTPVDTTTPGEKDVTVVAKLNGQPITEIPAKIVVVEPKTQYVPVNAEGDKKPKPQDSITPDDYPAGSTFEYKTPEGKTEAYDGSTPGDKDVTVVVKDSDGDPIVEVPAKIKVVQGKEQLTPVNAEDKDKPKAEDSITPGDYPAGSTFEYKIPEGKTEAYDGSTPGDKPVTVVVKDKDGKVLVEVPATIKVVETKPTPIETPVTNTPLTQDDYTRGIKIPDGGEITKVENIPDLTTPGKKDPVKVTITLPNGKSYTVDVPVTVTPVKEIETPVTNTPLTKDDYTKGITIPEGGKVTNVENIPDLTTPGKKEPVKVTITLPNGKVVTVEVPVNVTPITPIETPVTKDKLTPEDILKQIKVPEGATAKVGDLPDLTTPGKKEPVKVTITLPNGKVVTVEIPVNVTPIEDIVKKEGDPITTEDVEKHIPKGVKVISIGEKPTTDVPGERPSIPVVIELPNGIRVTVNIPVIVTPKVTPVVVSVGTPVTPEDVKKHIELPKGWTVTKVGEIPTTTTPGTKPVVPVEIELPDGRKITVEVPVIVTPTVRQIVVPQGTPITPDDVKGHIDLPKEPGWEIIEVGEIPTTIPAGVKPSVKVKIKVPTGEIVEVEVPIIVTPKVTPIVVEVGTPITKEDVIKKAGLPEGWEIVEVGEIPTTETPGTKPVVKVKVKLPDGRIITVEVPVTVTPKSQNGGGFIAQNGGSTVQIVTEYLDENGNRITSDKEGKHNPIELEGYEYSHSTTDAKGNTLHHYKKMNKPINQEQPSSPETPTSPEKPVATPVQDSKQVAETTVSNNKKELPNTGTEDKAGLASLGLLGMLGAFGLVARKKKED